MKKLYSIVVVMGFSILPMHAAEPTKTSYAGIAKKKALHQFNESVARIKRCFKGKCTKREALLTARDLGIAALATVTLSYGAGSAIEKATKTIVLKSQKSPYHETLKSAASPIYKATKYMKAPVQQPYTMAKRLVRKQLSPPKTGQRVTYQNNPWNFFGYDRTIPGNVLIWVDHPTKPGEVMSQSVPESDLQY